MLTPSRARNVTAWLAASAAAEVEIRTATVAPIIHRGDISLSLKSCAASLAAVREALVGVTWKPWRSWLPDGQPGVVIANRHLDLRQTLFVEDCVFRDHLVHEEQ